LRSDANRVGLGRSTNVADIDIVIACGEIKAGTIAQCNVASTSGVVKKRLKTVGHVGVSLSVIEKRLPTRGCVVGAGQIAIKRLDIFGCAIAVPAIFPGGHGTGLGFCERHRRNRKVAEQERDEKQIASPRRAINRFSYGDIFPYESNWGRHKVPLSFVFLSRAGFISLSY
jgi:hypothetical protein